MKISGYSERYRENIIKSALVAWDRMVEQDEKGERPLYRDNTWRKEERRKEKEKKKNG